MLKILTLLFIWQSILNKVWYSMSIHNIKYQALLKGVGLLYPECKNGDKLDLTADFNLKTAGTLTLLAKDDGTFKEISRTDSAPSTDSSESITGTVLDASLATDWKLMEVQILR